MGLFWHVPGKLLAAGMLFLRIHPDAPLLELCMHLLWIWRNFFKEIFIWAHKYANCTKLFMKKAHCLLKPFAKKLHYIASGFNLRWFDGSKVFSFSCWTSDRNSSITVRCIRFAPNGELYFQAKELNLNLTRPPKVSSKRFHVLESRKLLTWFNVCFFKASLQPNPLKFSECYNLSLFCQLSLSNCSVWVGQEYLSVCFFFLLYIRISCSLSCYPTPKRKFCY